MIDLRSDTCSKPTAAMRQAMAQAEVGDDVYGDDPTVRALERRVAEILDKEDAVYMPTGTMTNQIALRTHTEAGDEVLTETNAHLYLLEGGAPSALSGLMIRHIHGHNGVFGAAQLRVAVGVKHPFMPSTVSAPTKLVCVENTHNVAGGVVWPIATVLEVAETAHSLGVAAHLDGARLWHAAVKTGVSEADYAAPFDSVSVCFSKGLGAPIGSALAGTARFVERARRFKQMFGGGFRQAGIVAAGALYALEHHRQRLCEDHDNAAEFAAALAAIPGIEIDPSIVQTNIVRFRVTAMSAGELVERCHQEGVHMLPSGLDGIRAVMYLDIGPHDVEEALRVIRGVMAAEAH